MKKNFFKKLSFVMALAMIVTALAPAAGVFAAAAPKLNAKTVYLHVAEKTTEFDFNVANKKAGWKYSWKSNNEDVAEVASNGLATAVGVGTATVSVVIKDKNGEKVDTLKAKVVVRDNIKKLTITNTPAGGKLAVGAKNDFNRSFVTASGSKTKTSGITRWEVDKTGATIVATSGLFTATEAGTYKVTARAFQSADKYASWLADKTKYASYVTATAETTVKVAASMVKAEQTDLNSLKVTFDSPVTDAASKLSVVQVVSGTEVLCSIDKVTMSADNKEATVDMSSNFTEEFVYKVKYPELTDVQFTAAKVDPALVTSIAVKTTTVQENRGTDVNVALYNKDMVNIANDTLLQRITIETSATNSSAVGRTLYMNTKGSTTTVKATYHTYNYDTTGSEVGNLTASGVVTCIAYSDFTLSAIKAYSVKSSTSEPDWLTVNHSIAVDDASQKLWIKITGTKWDGSSVEYVNNATADAVITAGLKFSSSNNNVLVVNEATGMLTPVTTGSASIIVKFNDTVVGAVTVTVTGKRTVSTAALATNSMTLSNLISGDPKRIALTVKDQFNEVIDDSRYTVSVSTISNGVSATFNVPSGADSGDLVIDANGATVGTYTYTLTIEDVITKTVARAAFTLTVNTTTDPGLSTTNYTYQVDLNKTNFDMKVNSDDTTEDVVFSVYKLYNGVRIAKVPVVNSDSASALWVKVVANGSTDKSSLVSATGAVNTLPLVDTVAKAGQAVAVSKQPVGAYTVTVYDGAHTDKFLASSVFSVKDTQPVINSTQSKWAATIDDETSTDDLVLKGVKACLDITLDGKNVEDKIFDVVYTNPAADTYVITSIKVKEELVTGAQYVLYEVNKNISLNLK